jgi:phosphoglycolate phosphatase-like HAD superfamily hydrolase
VQDTIAVVFDFDETLAPDSTSTFLNSLGVDVKAFWGKEVEPLLDVGWDPVPAYLYMMVEKSRTGGTTKPITQAQFAAWGKAVKAYDGATRIFERLRKTASSCTPGVSVEFYLVSSGIGEILRNTRLAKEFTSIWGCEFHYDGNGAIDFPSNIVSFTDKTRYLFHVSKGLIGAASRTKPFEVNKKVPANSLRVPFDQMIFVGDGYTDIPCFSLVRKQGGVAIGVYDPEDRKKWGRAWGFIEDGRVSNLVPADYGKGSALSNSLIMAVESVAARIALRRSTYQG